jgi:hypothetical protein
MSSSQLSYFSVETTNQTNNHISWKLVSFELVVLDCQSELEQKVLRQVRMGTKMIPRNQSNYVYLFIV